VGEKKRGSTELKGTSIVGGGPAKQRRDKVLGDGTLARIGEAQAKPDVVSFAMDVFHCTAQRRAV